MRSAHFVFRRAPPVFFKILDARVRLVDQGGWFKERGSKSGWVPRAWST